MGKLHLIADELGQIRSLIRVLKAREDELRQRILNARMNGPVEGSEWEVSVRRSTRRSFLRDLLPQTILNDPRYWEDRATETVVARPKGGGRPVRDDDPVIEHAP